MDEKLEYLKMIEAVVERMAHNSFMLKGWAITLVSGLFGLSVWNDAGCIFYCLIYVPLFVFWFLDAYYLRLERLYRALYEKVRIMDSDEVKTQQFSMKVSKEMVPSDYYRKSSYFQTLFSVTEAGLYLSLVVLLTITIMIIQ